MNRENMVKWITALRSGQFEQGTGRLASVDDPDTRENPKYCCLGVACEVAVANGVVLPTRMKQDVMEDDAWIIEYDGDALCLPKKVLEWLDLPHHRNISILYHGNRKLVSEMNDEYRWTFDQIADALEKLMDEEGK